MADSKVSDLTLLAAMGGDELLYVVDDPGGTPLDRKMTLSTLLARANHTGTQPSSSISDFAAQVKAQPDATIYLARNFR